MDQHENKEDVNYDEQLELLKRLEETINNTKKSNIIFAFIKSRLIHLLIYFISYLAVLGLISFSLEIEEIYYIFIFIGILSLILIIKRTSLNYIKVLRNKKLELNIFFWVILLIGFYFLNEMNLGIKTINYGYILLFFLGGEVLVRLMRMQYCKIAFRRIR